MKKRILSMLLVAVMLATMIVVPAYAQDTAAQTEAGYCQHCKKVIPEDQWQPWDITQTTPESGHYYLANDIANQEKQINIGVDTELERRQVCLDLRGRSYTVMGVRPFGLRGIFSIMDSVGGGEIAVTGASNAHGGLVQAHRGKVAQAAAEFNLYSGTIRRINNDTDLVSYGGLIYMSSGATFNMYGGKLIGGEVVKHTIKSTAFAPRGGTIYCTDSEINIFGGIVTGGVAIDDHSDSSRYAQGGNIYAIGSTVNISGGTVENGACDTRGGGGGNIYATGSNVNISGGTVQGGYCGGAAGNINVSGTGKLTVSGGVIRDGVCTTTGGNLRVNSTNMAVEFTGGEIYGDIYVNSFKSLKLSGTPKIYMGNGNGLRLYKADNAAKVDVEGLTEGAVIYLDGVDQVFTDALENPDTYLAYFKDAIRADITVDESGALKVAQGATGFCPHCWESGNQVNWVAFDNSTPDTSVTVSATSTTHPTDANNQLHTYFTASITRTKLINVGAAKDTTPELIVDMAGKTLTVNGFKFANLYGKLSLLDSVGSGKITGTGHVSANGGVIMGSGDLTFNMYSGTLSRTVKSGEEGKKVYTGGVLYAPGGDVNIYGGIIRDGVAAVAYNKNPTRGGNVYASGKFTMTGGAIIGGKVVSCYGYLNSSGTLLNETTPYCGLGGNLYLDGDGPATISGGHIIGGSAGNGGNIYATAASTLTVTGGVIRDGSCNDETAKTFADPDEYNSGGNIFFAGGKEHKISGGIVRGGQCFYYGGNIRLTAATVTVENGSVIAEGIAGYASGDDGRGGNFHVNGSSTLELSDSTIGNGYAYNAGGNLFGPGGVKVNMHSGLICGGTAADTGGNMYCNGLNMSGGIVTGGTSGSQGGNIYVYPGAKNYLSIVDDGDPATPAPVVSNGTAGGLGGNIYLSTSCTGTLTGAVIENGNGDTGNKTTNFNGDNIYVQESASMTMTDTVVSGIVSDSNYGNGVYSGGALTLRGNTQIINDEKASCVYIDTAGRLTVYADFTGKAVIAFEDAHLTDVAAPHGLALAEQNTNTGVFEGKLFLEGYLGRDYGLPAIFAQKDDNKLYVASTAVIDAEGNETWYANNQDAVANCGEGSYVKLCTAAPLELTKDLTVDFNGKEVAVSGSYKLYGMDSSGDDFSDVTGKAVATDLNTEKCFTAPNGNIYVSVTDATGASFYRLNMRISHISLRLKENGKNGIYYKATWECNDAVKDQIDTFGVAVSVTGAPGSDFATDNSSLYTVCEGTTLVSGEAQTSVLISGILKNGKEDNNDRGQRNIYATPYVVLKDGTELGLPVVPGQEVKYSLYSALHLLDTVNNNLYLDNKLTLENFYGIWEDPMKNWGFTYIGDTDPTDDNTLNVLLIGNSFCYYFTDELYAMLQEQYPDKEVNVVNAYKSGCLMREHYAWLNDSSVTRYQFITVNKDGRKTLSGMSLKAGLMLRDWDIMSLQQHYPPKVAMDYATAWETIDPYDDALFDYLKTYFPKAELFWQHTWAYQIGYEGPLSAEADTIEEDNKVLDREKQLLNHQVIRQTALTVCENNGVTRVPLGDAWEIVRDGGNGYDNLCAREGTNGGLGDYYHDGDIGGGQYLNACVWFEMITGEDCRSLTYTPDYTLVDADEITFAQLAEAAHQAVLDMNSEG